MTSKTMIAKHYAKITEDNAGGLTLYVLDATTEQCVYAHAGYEYDRAPGRLLHDIGELIRPENDRQLMQPDSTADWDGNDGALVTGWEDLEIGTLESGLQLVAEVADRKITIYPDKMGAAAQREFCAVVNPDQTHGPWNPLFCEHGINTYMRDCMDCEGREYGDAE